MCNVVRVIFQDVNSDDIFVASIKHGVLFAGELVQSKDSAGTRTRTYWTAVLSWDHKTEDHRVNFPEEPLLQ